MNARRARFVSEYLIDLNGTQAAIRAGYGAAGAAARAVELLACEDVKAAVMAGRAEQDKFAKERANEAGNRAERAAIALEAIAMMDLSPLAKAQPALLNVKRTALVDLLKLDGQFKERIEHSGPDGGPIEMSATDLARRIAFTLTKGAKAKA